jgi:hypothetical protein
MAELLHPNDLKQITSDAEMAKLDEERQLKKMADKRNGDLREAFQSRDIHPLAKERINEAVRIAAEQGHHQVMVVVFPCSYCSDGGRRINIGDPEWPSSLEGFAKRAYTFYERELRPLGYKMHAEIISWPDGMPGDVGLFLKW